MRLGFITGSVRTGTTLVSRCIADHPLAISYRELQLCRLVFCRELNRHIANAKALGFTQQEIEILAENIVLFRPNSIETWLRDSSYISKKIFNKEKAEIIVEKDPDFALEPRALEWATGRGHKIIHTIRHPCGLRNVNNIGWGEKAVYECIAAYENIKQYKSDKNFLIVKYEDIVTDPKKYITLIYNHLGLKDDFSFLNRTPHYLDSKIWSFYSNTVEAIDPNKAKDWKKTLPKEIEQKTLSIRGVKEYMEEFSYA